jgi:hypothetical protein
VWIKPYEWYVDQPVEFTLMDANLVSCDATLLTIDSFDNPEPTLLYCTTPVTGPLYLSIQPIAEDLVATSHPGYGFSVMKVNLEIEPNNPISSAMEIDNGTLIYGELGIGDKDYYQFHANAGQTLRIEGLSMSDSPESMLALYHQASNGYDLVAYSTRGLSISSNLHRRILDTRFGRAILFSVFMESLLGIDISPAEVMSNVASSTFDWMLVILVVAFLLFIFVLWGFVMLKRYILPFKYSESRSVFYLVQALKHLDQEGTLNTGENKTKLRVTLLIAASSSENYLTSNFSQPLGKATDTVRLHMKRISAQIMKAREDLSIPDENTLNELRGKILAWLEVFLTGEYGRFCFNSDHETTDDPELHMFNLWTLKHVSQLLAVMAVVALALFVTRKIWRPYQSELYDSLWLIVRYIVLIIGTSTIYERFGAHGPSTKPESKWYQAVQLILFFILPLLALDQIFQTNLVESIVKIISSLKIF